MTQPPVPALEPAFEVVVELGPLEDHGMTRAGHRRVVPIIGGAITGGIEAEIVPGGADWQLVRADGCIEVDGRYTARAADGSLLYLHAVGVRSGDPAVLEALLRGDDVDPSQYYFRATVTIESAAHPELERSLYVASYVREATRVRYVAYRVT
ncbi:DUF3237 domain-containing protein [Microbacterium fluvii]|uniref:UPF0311 protein ACFQRL_10955 n=1 Tax=Microbacterium fluvii TaxID=415215 RepID=A0ABW2HFX4_9MICO|nr:DUF3237 domain-containing protein [Microbacterium fluvii]MCU4673113.1 DUF3237 domain-containing protein [Microbacterium fluvii]